MKVFTKKIVNTPLKYTLDKEDRKEGEVLVFNEVGIAAAGPWSTTFFNLSTNQLIIYGSDIKDQYKAKLDFDKQVIKSLDM